MMSAPQIAFAFMGKPTLYKQRDNRLFPTWAYSLSQTLTQIPQSTVETLVFCLILYWVSAAHWMTSAIASSAFFSKCLPSRWGLLLLHPTIVCRADIRAYSHCQLLLHLPAPHLDGIQLPG